MKIKVLIICTICLIFLGCKKVDELTQFNMEFSESVVVPASTGANLPFNLFASDVETNSEATFEVNDTRKDLIEKILLTSSEIVLTSPSNADFSFLESISIFLSAEGLSEIKISWKENVAGDGLTTLKLDVTNADLKEYIKKDAFTLRLNTVTDEVLTSDHHFDVNSIFFVDAKVLGQ